MSAPSDARRVAGMERALRCACAALLALALALALPGSAAADLLEQVLARGRVRVAVSDGVPWMMRDAAGEPMGFSVDLARRLASDLELELELVPLPFAELLASVEDGRADVAASGVSITARRALRVDFTDSIGSSRIDLVAALDADGAPYPLDALDRPDAKLGFEAGTLFEDLARVRFPNASLAPFASEAEARAALLDGRVQALVAARPLPELLARENPGRLFVPAEGSLSGTAEGLALRRGEDAWRRVLDAWIAEVKANGFLARSRAYWFEDSEWVGRMRRPLREAPVEAPPGAPPAPAERR